MVYGGFRPGFESVADFSLSSFLSQQAGFQLTFILTVTMELSGKQCTTSSCDNIDVLL